MQMIKKNPFSRSSSEEKQASFQCKECKMVFASKESLERHRNKAKHFGAVHL